MQDRHTWLAGGGEMARLIAEKDWAQTPLGPLESWSPTLCTTVRLALASNLPINVIWGPQRNQIYNDAYRPVCGAKHPFSLGQDYQECWLSAWDTFGAPYERAAAGATSVVERARMFLDRNGYVEETFFSCSFSPIHNESGAVVGVFHSLTEVTVQALAERRLNVVRDLADRAANAQTVAAACSLITATFANHALDLPFVLLYLFDADGARAHLAGSAGLPPGSPASPLACELAASAQGGWPLLAAARTRQVVEVRDLAQRFGPLVCEPYPEPLQAALLLPIMLPGHDHPFGLLVAGVSPRRALDEAYRTFYLMLREGVTNALINARAYEAERKHAEALADGAERLREKDEQLSLVLRMFGAGMSSLNLDTGIGTTTPEWRDVLGFPPPPASPTFETLLELVHPDDRERVAALHAAAARVQQGLDFEFRINHPTRGERWLLSRSQHVSAPDGAGQLIGVALDITERKQTEAALRAGEAKYRTLFETIDEGFCIIEMLYNEAGQAIDYRFLEVNRVFERFIDRNNAAGQHGSELTPGTEAYWLAHYERVARTGEPLRVEHFHEPTGCWYSVCVSRVGDAGSPFIAALFNDITEGKRREAHQKLLVDISNDLSRISSEEEIIRNVGAKLAAYLQLSCYHYVDVDEARAEVTLRFFWHALQVPSILGTYPIDGFIPPHTLHSLRAKETSIVNDVQNDLADDTAATAALKAGAAAQKIGAYIAVPYSQDGKWKAYFAVADSNPRRWTSLEVELVQQISNLVFPRIERARAEAALRESEAKYRTLFESIDEGFCIIERVAGEPLDFRYLEANQAFTAQSGVPNVIGKTIRQVVPGEPQEWFDIYNRVLNTQEPIRFEHELVTVGRVLELYAFPVASQSVNQLAVIFKDITERKRREQQRDFLLKFSDALKPLANPEAVAETACRMLVDHLNASRAQFNEVEGAPGAEIGTVRGEYVRRGQPMLRRYPLAAYGEPLVAHLRSGQTLVLTDTDRDPSITKQQRQALAAVESPSAVAVPRVKEDRFVAVLTVHDAVPRDWTAEEIVLIEEIAERTWAAVERAKAEQALREGEERLRLATEAADMYAWEIDLQTGVPTFSANVERVIGTMPTSSLEENLQAVHPDDRALVRNAFDTANGDNAFAYEMRTFTHDNRLQWFRVSGMLIRDGQNKPVRAVGISQNISARKSFEQTLQQANERFRIAEEASNGFVYDWNVQSGTTTRSEGFHKVLGYAPGEIAETADAWLELVHPDDRSLSAAAEPGALGDANNTYAVEYRVRAKNGSYIYVFDRGVALRDNANAIIRIVGSTVDITERRQAEQALRDSEARFRTLSDAVPQVIWANEAQGEATYFNQRWFEYSGLSLEESIGPGWQAIVHPDDAPASVELWNRALAKGTIFDTEYRLRRADGAYRWFIGRNVPLHNENGQVIGWFGSATDIEDLKQAQHAVREAAERLRIAVDAAEMGTWDWQVQTGEVYWNERHFLLFGMTPTNTPISSEAFFSHIHPEDREWVSAQLQRAVQNGVVFDAEFRVVRDDGVVRWISGYGQAVAMLNGDVTRMSGVMLDITGRKQAEEALQQINEELEMRVAERTDELAATNHTLRQEIAERRQLEAQRAALLERIITAQEGERQRIAHELHDTLGQLLSALNLRLSLAQGLDNILPTVRDELAQLQALTRRVDGEVDRLTLELRPPALEHLGLADALHSYAQEWTATSGVAVDVLVRGLDSTRLAPAIETTTYRIVQEALSNVLKHAQATVVSVIVERRASELRVVIEDDGVGFEAHQGVAEGTGGRQVGLLGMAERATLAGGELTIESEPGAGTTIYLQIPLSDDTEGSTGSGRG